MNGRKLNALLFGVCCLAATMGTLPAGAQDWPDCAYLYEHWDFEGIEVVVPAQESFDLVDFNDMASSIKVDSGCYCRVYEHSDSPESYRSFDARNQSIEIARFDEDWNDKASSVWCMRTGPVDE
jgi:hypothetical protein